MKITITGVNPYGMYKTEEHDVPDGGQVVTGLMPMSISIDDPKDAPACIRFDYEVQEEIEPPLPSEEPTS